MNLIIKLTREEIITGLKESKSILDFLTKIGLSTPNATYYYKVFKNHCKNLNLNAYEFIYGNDRESRKLITNEQLLVSYKNSNCRAQVLRNLELAESNNQNHRWLKAKEKELKIDKTHWETIFVQKAIEKNTISLENILIENSTYNSTGGIKRRLLAAKLLKYKCYECGLTEWNNKYISLQLEHKNGINNDNRLENLELLCPNCHSQTNTFAGKNAKHQKIPKNKCAICDTEIYKNSLYCRSCVPKKTKIIWPSYKELQKLVEESNFSAAGRFLGVTDNAIRKRLRTHKE